MGSSNAKQSGTADALRKRSKSTLNKAPFIEDKVLSSSESKESQSDESGFSYSEQSSDSLPQVSIPVG